MDYPDQALIRGAAYIYKYATVTLIMGLEVVMMTALRVVRAQRNVTTSTRPSLRTARAV